MSVLVARLACLAGFLLLGYAAVDTIEYRHALQVSNQGFKWPRPEAVAALVGGSLLALYAGLAMYASFVPIAVQRSPPNPKAMYLRSAFLAFGHRGTVTGRKHGAR